MSKLIFKTQKESTAVEFTPPESLHKLLALVGIAHTDFACGGKGTCRKCKIRVISGMGNISAYTETEKKYLSENEISDCVRYACMCELVGDATISADAVSEMKIQTEGMMNATDKKNSRYTKTRIKPQPPTLENPVADDANLVAAVGLGVKVPLCIRREFTDLLIRHGRDGEYDVYTAKYGLNWSNESEAVTIESDTVVKVKPALEGGDIYGAAVDIGTTTLAVYLVSLTKCEIIATAAAENPQRRFGADVISRINHTIENENGLHEMKKSVLDKVFALTTGLCEKNNINISDVVEVVLAGNTVMEHLATGLSPKNIAFAPFAASSLFDFAVTLGELLSDCGDIKTTLENSTRIFLPLSFASYVGGDISCGIISSGTDVSDSLRLFLDIGTNGEIGLGNAQKLTFCATAAGPAFEGAHIKQGLPGIEGAVSEVSFGDGVIEYKVIGDKKPAGICGSGIIDAAAVLVTAGIIDETGRIIDADEAADELDEKYMPLTAFIGEEDGETVFYIDKTEGIYITQKDVREIQLAKAAVRAGIETLFHKEGKKAADISELILAGGFGAHINKKSACVIGMIPEDLEGKIIVAGNTAGTGAVKLMLDRNAATRVERIKAISQYIELSGDSFFMDEYVDKMMF